MTERFFNHLAGMTEKVVVMGYNSSNYNDNLTVDYIAHPISGDIIGNITKVLAISRQLHFEEGVIPSVPYASFLLYLDDTAQEERMMGVVGDKAIIARAADGIQIFGPKLSFGVKEEAKFLKELGRRVTLRNPALEEELSTLLNNYAIEVKPFELKREYVQAVEKNLSGLVNNATWLNNVEKFAKLYERPLILPRDQSSS